jgi:hypothetical protein
MPGPQIRIDEKEDARVICIELVVRDYSYDYGHMRKQESSSGLRETHKEHRRDY